MEMTFMNWIWNVSEENRKRTWKKIAKLLIKKIRSIVTLTDKTEIQKGQRNFPLPRFVVISASAAVSTSTAKKQEDNDDPAAVTVSVTAAIAAAEAVTATCTKKNDDPENVASTGTVTPVGKPASTVISTTVSTSTIVIASTSGSFFAASTVCSS